MVERKVAVVTDVAADLPPVEILRSRYNVGVIEQIPLEVSFGENSYIMGKDLDNDSFKKLVLESGKIPKTAALGPNYFLEKYEKVGKEGLDILSIHLGSNLSSTINQAKTAAIIFDPNRVIVYDSGTASMAQGFLAIMAEEAAERGASKEEIINILNKAKETMFLRAITPNMPYLRSSGRISSLTSMLGDLIKINPILQIDQKKVVTADKPRAIMGAVNWMVNFSKRIGKIEQIAILDFEAKQNADFLRDGLIEANIPEEIIYRGRLGLVGASHGGPGTIGVAFKTNTL
jgi:DegV family protein with EDD domain